MSDADLKDSLLLLAGIRQQDWERPTILACLSYS